MPETAMPHWLQISEAREIFLSKFLSYRNGKAVAHSHAETNNHEIDGTGGAYCRQCLNPQILSHNNRIHHVVKLLKQHAKQHREENPSISLDGDPSVISFVVFFAIMFLPSLFSRNHQFFHGSFGYVVNASFHPDIGKVPRHPPEQSSHPERPQPAQA